MGCKVFCQIFIICCFVFFAEGTAPQSIRDLFGIGKGIIPNVIPGNLPDLLGIGGKYPRPTGPCPLCDSSVYSYCSDKLFHDSCCCSGPYDRLPYQCQHADCSFLHANSCYEHRLITQCCCTNHILYKK